MKKKNSQSSTPNLQLSEEKVRHVAKLANLTLSEQEVKKFQKELSEVLSYIDLLKKLETKDVEPTAQVTGLQNVFREDEIGESLKTEEVFLNAPPKNKGLFVVKGILKK